METALLFVHLFVAVGLVALVLMQRSEGGALGMGGGGGGLMTGRGAADVLARATTILAAVFFLTSMSLTLLAQTHRKQGSVIETAPVTAPVKPAPAPAAPPVRAAPLESYTPPSEGVVAPAPGATAERAAPLAPGVAPAKPSPTTTPTTTSPAATKPAPTTTATTQPKPAPKPAATAPTPTPAESIQTAPSAPAQPQLRPRAGPDE